MWLSEPRPTQGDLSFRLFGFPIRITPWFWLVTLLLGWGGRDNVDARLLLTWVAAVFLSILIHELGHGFAFRHFGYSAHVVLYQFGGLAIPDGRMALGRRTRQRPGWEQILISAAGPAAQMLVAAAVIAGLLFSGHPIPLGGILGDWLNRLGLWLDLPFEPRLAPELIVDFLFSFLYVSVYWALVNLLPIYPLDGGQISRELFQLSASRDALRNSLVLSVAAAGLMAIYGFSRGDTYLAILFGMLAYDSYVALQQQSGGGGYGRGW